MERGRRILYRMLGTDRIWTYRLDRAAERWGGRGPGGRTVLKVGTDERNIEPVDGRGGGIRMKMTEDDSKDVA